MRIICPNLRDYPGSSPYTPAELDSLWSNDAEKEQTALRLQGTEIATFLEDVILTGKSTPVQEVNGKKTGGLVLLSWSLGNVWSLAMFANIQDLESKARIALEEQLRAFVMYGKPESATHHSNIKLTRNRQNRLTLPWAVLSQKKYTILVTTNLSRGTSCR